MNVTFEEFLNERIKIWDETKKYIDTYLEEGTDNLVDYYGPDYDRAEKLILDIDKKYEGLFDNTFVLCRRNNLDRWTPYKISKLNLIDVFNGYVEALHLGRNFKENNHRRLSIRKVKFKSVSEDELKDMFGWHKTKDENRKEKFLYIFKNELGRIKIGQAISVEQRNHNIKIQAGISIEILNMIEESARHEKTLHRIFKSKKYAGEWFDLNDKDILWLKGLNKVNIDSEIKYFEL